MYRGSFQHMTYRGGRGLGFRGSSPPWPHVGIGRGGLPRCGCYVETPQQEADLLKRRVELLKKELENTEKKIHELESSESKP